MTYLDFSQFFQRKQQVLYRIENIMLIHVGPEILSLISSIVIVNLVMDNINPPEEYKCHKEQLQTEAM